MRIPLIPARPQLTADEVAEYIVFRTIQISPFERLAAVAGAVTILAFVWWDRFIFDVALSETLYIRLGLAALLLLLLGVTFTRFGNRHLWTQALATVVVVAGFSLVLTRLPGGFTVGLAGLALSVALLPMLATTFGQILGLIAIAVASPNLFLLGMDTDTTTYVNVNLWMLLASALAVAFWWLFDTVNRRLFLSERHVAAERLRADSLLENILPASVAEQLKTSSATIAREYNSVTILFADIVGFTAFAMHVEPTVVVSLLNQLFSQFDDLTVELGLEKIKTSGDGYMVAGGVPEARNDHARSVAELAFRMIRTTSAFADDHNIDWKIRIGINSGPVVAGVIGKRKFAYDMWGDAVNVASRLESTSLAGAIQVSESTAKLLGPDYQLQPRGTIMLKNRGEARTYFLLGRKGDRVSTIDLTDPEFNPVGDSSAGGQISTSL
jgi:class 3 adenylate cyclase